MTYIPVHGSYASYDPVSRLAAYFRDKQAMSPASAVLVNRVDWIALGMGNFPEDKILKLYTFIKKLSPDKYWLDVVEVDVYYKRQNELVKKVIIVAGVLMIVLILFGIFADVVGI